MSFEDLPPLPPLLQPGAAEYAERICAQSRLAMAKCVTRLDLPYGSDYWQKVDIYLPGEPLPGVAWPVLSFIHGGAWMNGCKEWLGFMAPALVDTPMVFVSISHRLAPQTKMPEIVDDCLDAIAWVYKNIKDFGGDPNRISIGGHSAGAHLASLVALRRDLLQARGLPRDTIKACLPVSGTFDFRFSNPAPGTIEHRILHEIMRGPDEAWEFSPLRYVRENDTPFFVTWGESDFPRVARQGETFVPALRAEGGIVRGQALPGYDHFTVHESCAHASGSWASVARRWVSGGFDEANPKVK